MEKADRHRPDFRCHVCPTVALWQRDGSDGLACVRDTSFCVAPPRHLPLWAWRHGSQQGACQSTTPACGSCDSQCRCWSLQRGRSGCCAHCATPDRHSNRFTTQAHQATSTCHVKFQVRGPVQDRRKSARVEPCLAAWCGVGGARHTDQGGEKAGSSAAQCCRRPSARHRGSGPGR